MLKQPTVHILLATYNGERFLAEQLESIARQTYDCWTLTVSDDGSTDNTLGIVQSFASKVHQPVTVLQGPHKRSSTANFFHLIANAQIDRDSDLYAFCDQDDVWFEDKLERAVKWHLQHTSQQVRLYCGRTQFADDTLSPISLSPNIKRQPSFGNALVQNIASGNTMVLSHAVLVSQQRVLTEHSIWHDWTTYIVTTALNGLVWFDDKPCLFYRQHSGNVIGSNNGFKAQIKRLKPLFNGRFKEWNERNIDAIYDLGTMATQESRSIIANFQNMRSTLYPWKILIQFWKSSIRRQNQISNWALLFALILKLA